jgi:hypothetical protein
MGGVMRPGYDRRHRSSETDERERYNGVELGTEPKNTLIKQIADAECPLG